MGGLTVDPPAVAADSVGIGLVNSRLRVNVTVGQGNIEGETTVFSDRTPIDSSVRFRNVELGVDPRRRRSKDKEMNIKTLHLQV